MGSYPKERPEEEEEVRPILGLGKTKDQILKDLKDLRSKVSQLGHDHLHNNMPMYLERFSVELEPFILLEKSFDEAINKFEYNAAKVWEK